MPLIGTVIAGLLLSPISLVSVSSTGAQANNTATGPAVSADGRFVAFQSFASNLVPGDTNGRTDVFVRDRRTGRTDRVSLTGAGGELSDDSGSATISADGRYVAFVTAAAELAPGEPNGAPLVYVRDRRAGTTELICTSTAEVPAQYECGGPAISADGRYVAFETLADTLVAGDTNGTSDIFVRDRLAGTTTRVSVSGAGRQSDGDSRQASISHDGRLVAFESRAANLVRGDTNGVSDVFVRDRRSGTTTRASVSTAGRQGNGSSSAPRISAGGRHVVFVSSATNFGPGGTRQDVFLRDRQAGTTTRASVSSNGEPADQPSAEPDVSADGRYVTFTSDAGNLGPAPLGEAKNAFIRDRRTGRTTGIAPAGPGDQPLRYSLVQPTISDDGSTVAFATQSPGLVPPGTVGYQILAYDNRR